jgi:hypothetical protein
MSPRRIVILRSFAIAAGFGSIAHAQTPLSGNVFDGGGGPLVGGTVYHATGQIVVPAGQTLTIPPGVIIKFSGNGMSVEGTLSAVGTSTSKIVFTSIQDDAAGGDTNGNGPSSGAPDQWQGFALGNAADASVLDYAEIAYTGVGFSPAIRCDAANITLRRSTLRDGQHGLLLLVNDARPIVENSAFARSGSQPCVFGATLDALPKFAANTAAGSGAGNFIRVDAPAPAADVSIVADDLLNGWLVFSNGISVPVGRTLTLGPGIFAKPTTTSAVQIDGNLVTLGTQESPVVFTSFPDDVYGGDTNNNGPSTGAPDQWVGLRFAASAGASALANTVVRYTGVGFSAAIEILGSSPTFTDCLFRNGQYGAIDLNGIPAAPSFVRCAFQDNFNYAAQIPIGAAAGFVDCVALGSTYGQFLRIVDGALSSSITLGPENLVNGAFVLASTLVVPQGVTLTLRPGATFKCEVAAGVTIQGALNVAADGSKPVVFTRIEDDEFGGDTNSNGPSAGFTDSWYGVSFAATATGSVVGARVRYSGAGYTPGFDVQSPNVSLRAVRADDCAHDGIRVYAHSGEARDWTAWKCRDNGIALHGGSFAIRNATVTQTMGNGIRNHGGFGGSIRDSILFGNFSGDVSGITAGSVSWSLVAALAGQNNNIGGDPLFVSGATGDLRLAAGSPCIEGGDPASGGTGADAGGAPRFADGNLDGVRRIDAGAYEFSNVYLAVGGTPKPGGVLTVATSGTPSLPALLAIGFDGQVELPPYGTLFINVSLPWLLLPFATVPLSAPLPIPSDLSVPLEVAFQAIVTSGPQANLSNVQHVRLTH